MHAAKSVRNRSLVSFAAFVALGALAARADGTVQVAASANLSRAGGNAAIAGTDPPSAALDAGSAGRALRFVSVTGTTDCDGAGAACAPAGPDGAFGGNVTVDPIGKLAAIAYRGADSLPLLGVLLGPDLSHPLPQGLDFRNAEGFESLEPELGQVFWIGDGRTGTGAGAPHAFRVPSGATRLFVGFYDDTSPGDTGTLTASFVVPEPSGSALALAVALASLCVRLSRRP